MPQFAYSGIRSTGEAVSGQVEASDQRDAFTRLREAGVYPTVIARQEGARVEHAAGTTSAVPARLPGRVHKMEISFFTRQLADLVGAGLPLHRSLEVVRTQAGRQGMRQLVADLQEEVQQGSALSAALERHPGQFPLLYRRMVAAGEASGHLPEVLERLAEFMERDQERRTQLLSAFTYPLVLIGVAVGAVAFLISFLIPRLASVFADMRQELPLPTRVLLAVAGFIGAHWWLLILGLVAFLVIGLRLAASGPGRRFRDALLLWLPVAGGITQRASISRFARTLGTMVEGGVPILQALEVAAGASGNVHVAAWVTAAAERVRQGEPLHQALAASGRFTENLLQLVAVGEETANLPRVLARLAAAYDFEVDQHLRRLTTMLEPAIIVCMGALVGFIVLSILLPIFQINATIR